MNLKHIMLDLETLGTDPGSVVTSIGAVTFDPHTGEVGPEKFKVNISPRSAVASGLTMDPGTVIWWLQRGREAIDAMLTNQKTLHDALLDFNSWALDTLGPEDELTVWGNGATFDNVLVSGAYKAAGFTRPWSYGRDFCYRTVKNMFRYIPEDPREGIHHDSLSDAIHQAKHLCKIAKSLPDEMRRLIFTKPEDTA